MQNFISDAKISNMRTLFVKLYDRLIFVLFIQTIILLRTIAYINSQQNRQKVITAQQKYKTYVYYLSFIFDLKNLEYLNEM